MEYPQYTRPLLGQSGLIRIVAALRVFRSGEPVTSEQWCDYGQSDNAEYTLRKL